MSVLPSISRLASALLVAGLLAAPPAAAQVVVMDASKKSPELASGATLKVGDPAPALKVSRWLKGTPLPEFKKGQVYVLEFWATWCGPCKAAIPHITELAKKYEGKVTFIGMNIWEKAKSPKDLDLLVDRFMKEMGDKMEYSVAQDTRDEFMSTAWMKAAGRIGVPATFIVGGDGRLVWQGHPDKLNEVLDLILKGSFGVSEGQSQEKSEQQNNKENEEAIKLLNADRPGINQAFRAKDWALALKKIDETQAKRPDSIPLKKMLAGRRVLALGHIAPAKVQPLIDSELGKAAAADYLNAAGMLWDLRSAHDPRWNKLALSYLDKAAALDPGLVKREMAFLFAFLPGIDEVKAKKLWEDANVNPDAKVVMAIYLMTMDGISEAWVREGIQVLEDLKKESKSSGFDRYLAGGYFRQGRIKEAVIAQMGYLAYIETVSGTRDVSAVLDEAKAELTSYQLALKK